MPILKPFFNNDVKNPDIELPIPQDALDEALTLAGVKKDTENKKISTVRQVFNSAGASLENAAQQINNVMQRGETDAGRLRAAELTLKVHGVLAEMDEKPIPEIKINVIGEGNKTLINLVLPK